MGSFYFINDNFLQMITNVELIDEIAKKIIYRHRIKKLDMFRNTKVFPVVNARHHFYYLCKDAGIKVCEIQRYCERYGYPIDHASVLYGIKKFKSNEKNVANYNKLGGIINRDWLEARLDKTLTKNCECEPAIAGSELG
jgi:hypothetical protein